MDRTALVTGATGYIARHVIVRLLDAGWRVRGSVRSRAKAAEAIAAIRAALADPAGAERLELVELDLASDDGWREAAGGCAAMLHMASPFPIAQPRDPDELTRPAVEGTLRALRAATEAAIPKVVLTSSMVAVQYAGFPGTKPVYTEADWTDGNDTRFTAYTRSKTLAERAAWDYVEGNGRKIALTSINPGLVLGRPVGGHFGTSVQVLRRILEAKDPALPSVTFAIVDVADVAAMHVAALNKPEAAFRRFIASAGDASFADIARILAAAFPDRRIVTRQAPDFLIRMIGLFDSSVGTILPDLGRRLNTSSAAARDVFAIRFKDMRETIIETARYLSEKENI
ncbi:MAG: NAD-dependent epimerase/dehydratase family protein [Hyphomicrobiales bacterium]|nr:NAD-dependent epimerase/dehydratase family protein [Hyphomicrobiales bacterium]